MNKIKFAHFILKFFGWRVKGKLPDIPQYILIVAPHKHWYDIPIGWAAGKVLGAPKYKFMVKIELMYWPVIGWLLLKMGAMPVNRGKSPRKGYYTDEAIKFLEQQKDAILIIAPEGSRKNLIWHKSFYRICTQTGKPLVKGVFDKKLKIIFISNIPMYVTGNEQGDFEKIRSWYSAHTHQEYTPELY